MHPNVAQELGRRILGNTIAHTNITDRQKILGELISVKITTLLPTKMFPALACKSVKLVSQSVIITEKILR